MLHLVCIFLYLQRCLKKLRNGTIDFMSEASKVRAPLKKVWVCRVSGLNPIKPQPES